MTKPTPHRNAMLPRVTTVCLLIISLVWCGCGNPPMLVQKYLLEYPAPVVQKAAPLDDSLKVEQFAVAQAFNTTAMVYRTSPYTAENYNYSRWRVNPGYLVADYLTRDLRDSRLFKAVLSADSPSKARFSLEGGVAGDSRAGPGRGLAGLPGPEPHPRGHQRNRDHQAGALPEKLSGHRNHDREDPRRPGPGHQPGPGAIVAPNHHGRLPGRQESEQVVE